MMADILKKYGGIVMWRAFVYNPQSKDRAKQAYEEFMPLDGQFHDNVILQVKNGPVDFQPREPYSPLFTAVKNTPSAMDPKLSKYRKNPVFMRISTCSRRCPCLYFPPFFFHV